MSDEGLREIHLNGKQLVFLFMTATVVAVVIFLCGVLVGQGVRAEQTQQAVIAAASGGDPTVLSAPAVDIVPAPPDGTRSPELTFSYPDLLQGQDIPVERLAATPPATTAVTSSADPTVPRAEAPRPAPTTTPARDRAAVAPRTTTPAPRTAAARPAQPPANSERTAAAAPRNAATSAAREPAGSGFVVQVAAVRTRTDADSMARRLTAKGYPAFVTSPGTGAAPIFRVRVGKYNDRREAESVANRLKKEEQFDPWITR